MPRMAPLSVKFHKPTARELKKQAEKEMKTVSQLIREMVVLALAKSTNGHK